MANQDSGLIQALGTLSSEIVVKQYYNAVFQATGSGDVIASATQVSSVFTKMSGTGDIKISYVLDKSSGLIQMSGTLNSNETIEVLVNAFSTMYGFLTSNLTLYSAVYCSDLSIDFNEQMIESFGCKIKGESVALIRYRGDTYPVSTTLSKNGLKDTTGITFKMSTQIDDGIIYTVDGIINDSVNGIVDFPLDILAVGVAGSGVYDIQGNDGTYIYTYEKGVFTLLEDVTV